MKRMGITNKRAGVGAAAVLLLLAATSDGDAQSTSTSFGPPAAYVRANATIDYDVPTNADPNSPRHAFAEVTKGRGKAKVDAVATLNGQRGFGTLTSVRSFSPADLCGGDAAAAMFFVAYDPMNRDSVKVQIEYQAVADTGFPILESPGNPVELASASFFDLRVGRLGNYGWVERDQYDRATVYMPTVGGPVAPVLEVSGLHIRNSGDPFPGFNELVIRSQGQEIQRTRGSGPLEYSQQFTVDVPTSNAMLMTISGLCLHERRRLPRPHRDAEPREPGSRGDESRSGGPRSVAVVLDRAELLEVGIDPGPLEAVGFWIPTRGVAGPVAYPLTGALARPVVGAVDWSVDRSVAIPIDRSVPFRHAPGDRLRRAAARRSRRGRAERCGRIPRRRRRRARRSRTPSPRRWSSVAASRPAWTPRRSAPLRQAEGPLLASVRCRRHKPRRARGRGASPRCGGCGRRRRDADRRRAARPHETLNQLRERGPAAYVDTRMRPPPRNGLAEWGKDVS